MKKDNLYIIIPAYNEEENIKNVICNWYEIIEKIGNNSKLVIIDDGSKDKTYQISKKLKIKYPNLIIIKKENEGHGATLLYGYEYAIKNNANYIFQTDSDGQTIATEFWAFWNNRKKYDAIIGNRNNRKDGISRIIVTKVLKLSLFFIFHIWINDANTPFRLIKKESLEDCIKDIPPKFNLSNVLLTVLLYKKNYSVKFQNITFRPRQGGINSINLKKITKIGFQAIKDLKKINKNLTRKSVSDE